MLAAQHCGTGPDVDVARWPRGEKPPITEESTAPEPKISYAIERRGGIVQQAVVEHEK